MAGQRISRKDSDWILPVVIAVVALFLLLLILIGIGLWARLDGSQIAGGSGTASGSPGESKSSTRTDASAKAASQPEAPPSQAPSQPPQTSEGAKSSTANIPATQQPRGDTGAASGQNGPIVTQPKRDEYAQSVLGGSFFGIRAEGQRFVYVVDCSGSMTGAPYDRASQELVRSLAALSKTQEFFVILYSDDSYPMFFPTSSREFVKASDQAIEQVQTWVVNFSYRGGTNPEPALQVALQMKPDAVFFLTDGAIPDSTADTVRQANSGSVSVYSIGFTNRAGETVLRRIADENNGDYLFVP
jgi:hypothetical protein